MKRKNETGEKATGAIRNDSCEGRIDEHLEGEVTALRALWKAYQDGNENGHPDYGNFHEYGLSFDYVAACTFQGQKEPYFRYQLSYGGPSDEFRFFAHKESHGFKPYRIEYWFLDWFDGAHRTLSGKALELLEEIFAFFDEVGSTESEYQKGMEE